MKILALTNLYPRPGHEGLAPFNRQQFLALSADHDLEVVAPIPWPEALAARLGGRRIPVGPHRNADGVRVRHPRFYYPPRLLAHRYGEMFLACTRGVVERAIDESRPDVILSSWAHPDGWAAVRLARRAGLPCVIKVVGSDVLEIGVRARRRRRIAEALIGADAVVAVSRDLAGHVARLGVDPGRIRVVPEGVDLAAFRPGDRAGARAKLGLAADGPTVLFVGNLLRSKGVEVLARAVRAWTDRGLAARCVIVGRGRDERRLRALIARLGLGDRVVLAGPRPHAELPGWYAASDLIVLPSFSEGIPNVLREATACGRPFVATRVGGIPELADPDCRLVEPGSAEALAEAVASALADPPDPDELAARARRRDVTWAESARLLSRVLEEAIAGHRAPAGPPAPSPRLPAESARRSPR